MIKIINRGWLQEKGVWKSRELRESDKNRKEERNEAMKNLRSRFPSAREPTEQWRWCGKLPFLSGRYLCITIMRSRSKANWLQTGSVESKSPGKNLQLRTKGGWRAPVDGTTFSGQTLHRKLTDPGSANLFLVYIYIYSNESIRTLIFAIFDERNIRVEETCLR